jgi:hypothetical protein
MCSMISTLTRSFTRTITTPAHSTSRQAPSAWATLAKLVPSNTLSDATHLLNLWLLGTATYLPLILSRGVLARFLFVMPMGAGASCREVLRILCQMATEDDASINQWLGSQTVPPSKKSPSHAQRLIHRCNLNIS